MCAQVRGPVADVRRGGPTAGGIQQPLARLRDLQCPIVIQSRRPAPPEFLEEPLGERFRSPRLEPTRSPSVQAAARGVSHLVGSYIEGDRPTVRL